MLTSGSRDRGVGERDLVVQIVNTAFETLAKKISLPVLSQCSFSRQSGSSPIFGRCDKDTLWASCRYHNGHWESTGDLIHKLTATTIEVFGCDPDAS